MIPEVYFLLIEILIYKYRCSAAVAQSSHKALVDGSIPSIGTGLVSTGLVSTEYDALLLVGRQTELHSVGPGSNPGCVTTKYSYHTKG